MTAAATFVLCIENNAMTAQALLMCESIRQFGGRHRDAPILAIAPRPGLGVDRDVRRQLDGLSVEYVEEPLNRVCPEYGTANRVFAAAWAEDRVHSEWIVVLDSDGVFLRALELPSAADVAARPVDMKGSASEGPGDSFEGYWTRLAELQGVELDRLPFIRTTIDERSVRASYNGGLLVVRRETGILRKSAELFSRSIAAGLRPWKDSNHDVYASSGFVGKVASEYWGSSQATAAVAIWSTTSRVVLYPETYNVPLHSVAENPGLVARLQASPLVHVHYHWMFMERHYAQALTTLTSLGVEQDRVDWLAARLPLGSGF